MLRIDEWKRLESATSARPNRFGMSGDERWTLYQTAIQTGLRSAEIRSLTRGRLHLDADPPFITCKARDTKNRKDARQYIQPELATELKTLISRKTPKAPLFNLPHASRLAAMLREDLAEARKTWIREAIDDPDEYAQREKSEFLAEENDDGERVDFHCLRHTCGAWLAQTGAHPKVVQTVMRHSTITLTMDTYGHLFPGQEADAVAKLRNVMVDTPPAAARATGTDGSPIPAIGAQRQAQRAVRETLQMDAKECDEKTSPGEKIRSPKPLHHAGLGDPLPPPAASSGAGTRTPDTRIMIPLL